MCAQILKKMPNNTEPLQEAQTCGKVSYLPLKLHQARTVCTEPFALCEEIHISGLLNDLVAPHYRLESPVCIFIH